MYKVFHTIWSSTQVVCAYVYPQTSVPLHAFWNCIGTTLIPTAIHIALAFVFRYACDQLLFVLHHGYWTCLHLYLHLTQCRLVCRMLTRSNHLIHTLDWSGRGWPSVGGA